MKGGGIVTAPVAHVEHVEGRVQGEPVGDLDDILRDLLGVIALRIVPKDAGAPKLAHIDAALPIHLDAVEVLTPQRHRPRTVGQDLLQPLLGRDVEIAGGRPAHPSEDLHLRHEEHAGAVGRGLHDPAVLLGPVQIAAVVEGDVLRGLDAGHLFGGNRPGGQIRAGRRAGWVGGGRGVHRAGLWRHAGGVVWPEVAGRARVGCAGPVGWWRHVGRRSGSGVGRCRSAGCRSANAPRIGVGRRRTGGRIRRAARCEQEDQQQAVWGFSAIRSLHVTPNRSRRSCSRTPG